MIKKTLKFTLSALLLSAAGSAFAAGPVTLSDGKTTVSWKEFADVINSGKAPVADVDSTAKATAWKNYTDALATQKEKQKAVNDQQALVDAAQEAYDTENGKIKGLEDALNRVQPATRIPKYSDYKWFNDQRSNYNSVLDYVTNLTGGEPYVIYYLSAGLSKVLYLSFDGVTPSKPANTDKAAWTTVSVSKFYEDVIESSSVKFSSVKVFLGYKAGSTTEFNYTVGTDGYMSVSGYSSADKEGVFDAIATTFETMSMQDASTTAEPTQAYIDAQDTLEAQEDLVADKLADLNKEKAALTPLQTALNTANETVATTKAAFIDEANKYDAAVEKAAADALQNYQEVSLNANVDANTAITASDYKGTIDGNSNVINVASGNLFKKFTGQLSNAAVNGTFAGSYAGATFDNVAVNAADGFRYYDGHGSQYATAINSLGQLGFVARASFGVDFANSKLAAKSETTTVYDITVYGASTTQNYVTKNGTTLTGKGGATVTIPDNVFAKSATSDLTGINNVYYADGSVNVCDNVLIKDGVNFYCPEDITATALTYERSFSEGMNTVCLPFTLSHGENISAICTYDRETTEKFWFTYVAGDIEANTPALLFADAAFENIKLAGVKVAKTDNQVVGPAGNDQANSRSFGTLKKVNAGEFSGEFDSNKVYGLHGDKFQLAGTSASFNPFRMVISSLNAPANALPNAPRRIAIADENGVDITDLIIGEDYEVNGVEDIVSDAPEFGISGGQGEIVITSDVDYGKVVVYTVDGKAVAAANVVAGTTAVNVEKGLYIVMGKKVMVK